MCNCVRRCVSDGILEVFAREQKEQHPAHSPPAGAALQGELEKNSASDLSRPWQWWRWQLYYLLRIRRPCRVCRAVTVCGDFKRWLLTRQASRVGAGMRGRQRALPYPRGRGGHSSPSLLPKAQLPDPAAAFPHPAHPLTPLLLLFLLLLPAQPHQLLCALCSPLLAISRMQVGDCGQPGQDFLEGGMEGGE